VVRITAAGRARMQAVSQDMAAADALLTEALTAEQLEQRATLCDALVP
jgi:DNA-binding MarR family transcriptional regulator